MSRRVYTLIATLSLLFSVSGPAYAQAPTAQTDAPDTAPAVRVAEKAQFDAVDVAQVVVNPLKGATEGIFVIRLDAKPLATYRGGIAGLAPTSPVATGSAKLDTATAESRAYVDYLESSQATFVTRLEKAIGHTADVRYTYKFSLNGLAVWLTPSEAARVARMPGVESVRQEVIEQLNTDVGPTFIGAPGIWGGAACTAGGNCGEGVIVGVLDTGINPSNASFADPGPIDGYDYPAPAGGYLGACEVGGPEEETSFVCNDKLIGAWDYTGLGAVDSDGHGSHTASTAAGNFVDAAIISPTLTVNHDISGVAPHANIISYHVCGESGCPDTGTIAAIDQAIADGVDVINFSVGSGSPQDPWGAASQQAWLSAREAGIAVAHSAGNEGPAPATVGSPQAPWMMHVAATTHNRKYVNSVVDMTGGATTPPADIDGAGFTSGFGPALVVYAGDYASTETTTPALCGVGGEGDYISPWPADTFDGEIVVCDRGTFGRVEKGANVLAAGAGGYILVDNGSGLVGDAHELPGVHITAEDGAVLKTWLADGGSGHTATLSGAILDASAANGDILAGFSSRGPNRSVLDMISPSVAAPGVDIIAANGIGDVESWGFNSGTSMASPHAAGALALLVAVHPTWTPAELQSALMTTGTTAVLQEDGVTPATWFDQGSGRIQVDQATQAGLVLDIDNATFTAADPATGGDPGSLNLPSMANSQCVIECEWTRTVTATTAGTWTATANAAEIDLSVSPASFTLAEGATQDVTITANVEGLPNDVWTFGDVTLSATGVPDTLMPVAVAPSTGSLPASVEIATRRDAGSQVVADLTAIEITQLTIETAGLTIGDSMDLEVAQDSDNGSAFDDITDGVFWTTIEVPAGAWRLVAETYDSESPDLDLNVGKGSTPVEDDTLCTSASGSADEFCDITNPEPGTYWILVQNWAGSGAAVDGFTLATAVVGADEGNMLIEGPAQHPQLDPFDIRLMFNESALEEGDRAYGAFSIGTSPAKPGNVGTVPVNLVRLGDDVVKAVDAETAEPGDTLTYTITIEPNPTDTAIAYSVVDRIPDGLTYVPGSASGGLSLRSDGALTWSGVMPAAQEPFYTVTDSLTDPLCDTGFGGYVDLEGFGITTIPSIIGDTVAFTAFTSGTGHNPFNFYGSMYDGVSFTDDGYAYWGDGYVAGDNSWTPQSLPDATAPNNLLAGLWYDYELFYDLATNSGVSLASNGPDMAIIEFDNLQPFGGGDPLFDMELVLTSTQVDLPGWYEAVVAFDNITAFAPAAGINAPLPLVGTIGAENIDGSAASVYLDNDDAYTVIQNDGHMVCFDLTAVVSEAVVLTFDVTVDAGTEGTIITNEATHDVDTIGGVVETSSVDVAIGDIAPPTDGASLWAKEVLKSSLTLMWDAGADDRGVTGYGIYKDGVHLADVAGGVTKYDVSGLTPLTVYGFTVKAMDAVGNMSTGLTLDVKTSIDFTDDDFSIFEDDIEWLFSAGITRGCNPPANDKYCPNDSLTRGQLAAMLNRALKLPAATKDYFTDDEDSVFENDINRLAEAGITRGCNVAGDNYCPDGIVTRGELAAMLDRALDLPATTTDYFTDDDGHLFEASINSLAEAGLTRGCNPPANDNYCPNDLLTRGQIAAFLHRAFG